MTAAVREVLVVNPNSSQDTTAMLVRAAESADLADYLSFRGVTARGGPQMIVDGEELFAAAHATVRAARAATLSASPAAVIVAAFGDPGTAELRATLPFPVVGIGESAIGYAASFREPFAIATTTGRLVAELEAMVRRIAPESTYVGTFVTVADPVELATDPDRMRAGLSTAVDDAVAAGARTVIIGGGPLSDSATALATRTDVRIVEPVPAAVRAVGELLGVRT